MDSKYFTDAVAAVFQAVCGTVYYCRWLLLRQISIISPSAVRSAFCHDDFAGQRKGWYNDACILFCTSSWAEGIPNIKGVYRWESSFSLKPLIFTFSFCILGCVLQVDSKDFLPCFLLWLPTPFSFLMYSCSNSHTFIYVDFKLAYSYTSHFCSREVTGNGI